LSGLIATLVTIWRIAIPYFRSEDAWAGRLLLAAVIAIELAIVAITVLVNEWNNRFFNALQDRNWNSFVYELLYFCVLIAIYIVIAVYQLYLNQWLQIRWRRWMTSAYLGHWLESGNHYRMQLLGDAADNPDQRIAEDIRLFIERTLALGVNFLSSIVTLGSFIVILWNLSEAAPLQLFGSNWHIPGYLVWAALLYAALGTLITHLIGRPLIHLNFMQQRYEADFRFNLMRIREHGEQIALLDGEMAERERLMDRFAAVVANFRAIMNRTKQLTFFRAGYDRALVIFPYVVASPAYFAGNIQLGGLTQTASAFNSVQEALSFFVLTYRDLAEWRAVIDRLASFDASIATARAAVRAAGAVVDLRSRKNAPGISITGLDVHLPSGQPLIAAKQIDFSAGDRVLLNGPSGAGKSTLFRAIGGIWPFGCGSVVVPDGARVMILPQRPYLPIGSLAAAVSYPAAPDRFDASLIRKVLAAVGLQSFAERLAEEAHWDRMLSLGEQQRLAIARAILHVPDFLFLDEATASLDEAAEAALYRLINERLPHATIVSIGHRSTLAAFHRRSLVLEREGDRYRVDEPGFEAAAS
jgi:vitamin B12/bleomycin/antimicrobial peptide transport system ATP-binding/permease protein